MLTTNSEHGDFGFELTTHLLPSSPVLPKRRSVEVPTSDRHLLLTGRTAMGFCRVSWIFKTQPDRSRRRRQSCRHTGTNFPARAQSHILSSNGSFQSHGTARYDGLSSSWLAGGELDLKRLWLGADRHCQCGCPVDPRSSLKKSRRTHSH